MLISHQSIYALLILFDSLRGVFFSLEGEFVILLSLYFDEVFSRGFSILLYLLTTKTHPMRLHNVIRCYAGNGVFSNFGFVRMGFALTYFQNFPVRCDPPCQYLPVVGSRFHGRKWYLLVGITMENTVILWRLLAK